MQSKKGSFTEAVVNTIIGLGINLAFTPLFYWICGISATYSQLGLVTLLFTALSVARSYIIRRYFNGVIIKQIK